MPNPNRSAMHQFQYRTCKHLLISLLFATSSNSFLCPNYQKPRQFSPKARLISAFAQPVIVLNGDVMKETLDSEQQDEIRYEGMNSNAFETMASLIATTLYQSDMRRDAKGKTDGTGSGSSATNWIDDKTSFALQHAMNKIELKLPDERVGLDRDESLSWLRWMKTSPTPIVVDFTRDLIEASKNSISKESLAMIDTSEEQFYSRLSCKLYLLPSGSELKSPLIEPTGSIIFGKLIYGGVTRYRLLSSSTSKRAVRRVGEQTATKSSKTEKVPCWIVFGGSDRKYVSVDMGSAAVLEVTLLPKGIKMPSILEQTSLDMAVTRIDWTPQQMFHFPTSNVGNNLEKSSDLTTGSLAMSLAGKDRNDAFRADFETSVGGLSPQIDTIIRRVLDGRVIRPVDEDGNNIDDEWDISRQLSNQASQVALEAEELALLGLTPVKGLLLYGPPGCGKTALAREISKSLRARKPKIIAAPELLDRWVGSSEKLIRQLFKDAEAELAACNGDPTKSALHVIVIDEIDAVFRKRSSSEDSGETTRASAVNQILAKLDGVNAIPNVLLIGMTNRRELLDSALLRPGRLEVQIEIPLPNKEGRREILKIHFDALRKKGRLSKPLCFAIDGVKHNLGEEMNESVEATSKRQKLKRFIKRNVSSSYDLAADSVTGGFSGADLQGLVRCAGSIALARARKLNYGIEDLQVTLDDVKQALLEVNRKT